MDMSWALMTLRELQPQCPTLRKLWQHFVNSENTLWVWHNSLKQCELWQHSLSSDTSLWAQTTARKLWQHLVSSDNILGPLNTTHLWAMKPKSVNAEERIFLVICTYFQNQNACYLMWRPKKRIGGMAAATKWQAICLVPNMSQWETERASWTSMSHTVSLHPRKSMA